MRAKAIETALRGRAVAAEHALEEAHLLIADLHDQLSRANRAAVRMARKAGPAAQRWAA